MTSLGFVSHMNSIQRQTRNAAKTDQAVKNFGNQGLSGFSTNFFESYATDLKFERKLLPEKAFSWYDRNPRDGYMHVKDLEQLTFDFFRLIPDVAEMNTRVPRELWHEALLDICNKTARKMIAGSDIDLSGTMDFNEFERLFFEWFRPLKSDDRAREQRFGGIMLDHDELEGEHESTSGVSGGTFLTAIDSIAMPSTDLQSKSTSLVELQKTLAASICCYNLGTYYQQFLDEHLQRLRKILQKPPQARKITELQKLLSEIKDVNFFNKVDLPNHQQLELCRHLKWKHFEGSDQQVCSQGSTDDPMFYLVLGGQAQAYVHCTTRISGKMPVATLTAGHSFGETTLTKGEPRAISVETIGSSGCSFCVLDTKGYEITLKSFMESAIDERVRFFRRLPMFVETPCSQLQDIAKVAKFHHVQKGQVVIQQGQYAHDGVYFIQSGTFRVIKEVPLSPNEVAGEYRRIVQRGRRKGQLRTKARKSHHSARGSQTARYTRRTSNKANVSEKTCQLRAEGLTPRSQFLEVMILGQYDCFGELAMLKTNRANGQKTVRRNASVIVDSSTGTLLELSKFDWSHRLDQKTRARALEYSNMYPDDEQLEYSYADGVAWEQYKRTISDICRDPKTRDHRLSQLPVFEPCYVEKFPLNARYCKKREARKVKEAKAKRLSQARGKTRIRKTGAVRNTKSLVDHSDPGSAMARLLARYQDDASYSQDLFRNQHSAISFAKWVDQQYMKDMASSEKRSALAEAAAADIYEKESEFSDNDNSSLVQFGIAK